MFSLRVEQDGTTGGEGLGGYLFEVTGFKSRMTMKHDLNRMHARYNGLPGFDSREWVNDEEGKVLQFLADRYRVKNAFESGTCNGYSALCLASGMGEGGKVYTFDPDPLPKLWTQEDLEDLEEKIVYQEKPFADGLEEVARPIVDARVGPNLFFLDGEHTQTGLEEDFKAIRPLLRKGDLIVFHDTYGMRHVGKFVQRLTEGDELCDPARRDFETRRGMVCFFYQVEGQNREQIVLPELLHGTSHKAKEIDNGAWLHHDKPYNVWPHKGLHTSSEKHFIYLTAKRLGPGTYANLGTWGGFSTACLGYGIRDSEKQGDSTIVAVDIWSIPKVREMPKQIPVDWKRMGLEDHHIKLKICRGLTAFWGWQFREQDTKFDFILIDADHTYDSVKEDFEVWGPMLKVGGEIMFHDVEYEEIDRLLKEVMVEPEWRFVKQVWRCKLYRKMK
jgi:predicted O-methyltransferase YrrM